MSSCENTAKGGGCKSHHQKLGSPLIGLGDQLWGGVRVGEAVRSQFGFEFQLPMRVRAKGKVRPAGSLEAGEGPELGGGKPGEI